MYRGYGHHRQRGMRWMNRGFWWPGRWGFYRRPCCCFFFALPLMLVPLLAVAAVLLHFAGVHIL